MVGREIDRPSADVMLQRCSAFCGQYRSSGQPLAELKAPQSFWPEGVKDDEFPICRCLFPRVTVLGLLLDLIVQVLLSLMLLGRGAGLVKKWHETDLAVSDLETHQYLD